jgi:hypothetical protein
MCVEGSGLIQLHGGSHGRKEPTLVPMTTHPTPFQCEDVFDHALQRLRGLSALPAQFTVNGLIEDFNHLLAFHGMVMMTTKGGHQGHPSLELKRGEQILILRFPVHHDCLDRASKRPGFKPQALGFIRSISQVLEAPRLYSSSDRS